MSLEEEISTQMSKELSAAIDFEILSDILIKSCDWKKVELERFNDRNHSVDIQYWIESHTKGKFLKHGKIYIFEEQGDAVNFALRWL